MHCLTVLKAEDPGSRCWQGWSLLGLQTAPSPCVLTWPHFCEHACLCPHRLFLWGHQSDWIRAHPYDLLYLITSLKTPSLNRVTFWGPRGQDFSTDISGGPNTTHNTMKGVARGEWQTGFHCLKSSLLVVRRMEFGKGEPRGRPATEENSAVTNLGTSLGCFSQDTISCHPGRIPALPCPEEPSVHVDSILLSDSLFQHVPGWAWSPTNNTSRVWGCPEATQTVVGGAGIKTRMRCLPNTNWGPGNPRPESQLFRRTRAPCPQPLHWGPCNKHPSQIKPQQEVH